MALSIGVPPGYIVAFAAASYGYYILPTYPSDLATIQFDRSGTTRIGKYVINHGFILPGLIGVGTSCLSGYLLASARGLVRGPALGRHRGAGARHEGRLPAAWGLSGTCERSRPRSRD